MAESFHVASRQRKATVPPDDGAATASDRRPSGGASGVALARAGPPALRYVDDDAAGRADLPWGTLPGSVPRRTDRLPCKTSKATAHHEPALSVVSRPHRWSGDRDLARLAIGVDFLAEYARLEKPVQSAVEVAISKFAEHTYAGLHLEKIQHSKDDRIRTIRIDRFWRGVVLAPDSGDTYCLIKVLPHDKANADAASRRFSQPGACPDG